MRSQVQRFLTLYGQTVTLRRPGTPDTDVQVKAFIRGFRADDLPGSAVRQGEREVRIASRALDGTNWPVPPRKGDRVLTDTETLVVQTAETRAFGESGAIHVLTVKG